MTTSIPTNADVDAIRKRVMSTIHGHWKLFLLQGVLMLVLGMLAIGVPNVSTLAIEQLVGWLFVVGGFFRVAMIVSKRHMPGWWWSLVSGVLSIVVGAILIARPLQGVITLTILMSVFFVVEGTAAIVVAFEFRRYLRHWGWTLASGLINLLMAYLIWSGWPNTASWVIGLYVGINMIFFGVPLIMTAIAAHQIDTASS